MRVLQRILWMAFVFALLSGCATNSSNDGGGINTADEFGQDQGLVDASQVRAEKSKHQNKPAKKQTNPEPKPVSPVFDDSGPVLVEKTTVDYTQFVKALNNGEYSRAEDMAAQLLEAKPDDPTVLDGLAYSYRKQGTLQMAEILTQKVLQKNSNDLRALWNLAMINLAKKQESKALQLFLQIYRLNADYPGVKENLAALYLQSGMYNRGLAFLEMIYQDQKPSVRLSAVYGQALMEAGQWERALPVFKNEIKKGAADLAVGKDGTALIVSYLQVLKRNPPLIAQEKPTLKELAGLLGHPYIASRAGDLLKLIKPAAKKGK